jgi:hypothetical protein
MKIRMTAYHSVCAAILATILILRSTAVLPATDSAPPNANRSALSPTTTSPSKPIKATGYIIVAERTPTKEKFPDASPENLVAGSAVFTPPPGPVPLDDHLQWWTYVKGAN